MPKVSVIVPVYGVEKYIEKCARSLFQQTLEDMEYIFINDCTPDNSMVALQKVLSDFPAREKQVKIINLENNSGQAAVRKIGVQNASGDFIIFCDSDDWVDTCMYKQMYDFAIANECDVVRCLFSRVSDSDEEICKIVPKEAYNDKKQLLSFLIRSTDLSSTWDKLVKRDIFESSNFVYPKDNMCEDLVYALQYFLKANSVGYIDKPFYHYRQNESSISHVLDTTHICAKAQQISNNVELLIGILKQHNLDKLYGEELVAAKYMAKDAYRPILGRNGIHHKWYNCYKKINSKILLNRYLTIRQKCNFIFCLIGIYPILARLVKK